MDGPSQPAAGRGTVLAPSPGVRAYDPTSLSARVTHAQSGRSCRTTVAVPDPLADRVSETFSQVAGLTPEEFVCECLAPGGLSGNGVVLGASLNEAVTGVNGRAC